MFNQINGFNTIVQPSLDLPVPSLFNLNDMISQIQFRLGKRKDLKDEIIQEIKLAQYQLERDVTFNPYFLWRGKDLCLDPACLDYALPTGFIRLCEINNPLMHPEGHPFAYELNRGIGNVTYSQDLPVGAPSSFSVQAQNLRLDKRSAGVLRIFYITETTHLSEESPTNWWTAKAYDLLMNKAGFSLATILRDESAIQLFGTAYAMSLAQFKKECVAYEDYGHMLSRAEGLAVGLLTEVGGWYEPVVAH